MSWPPELCVLVILGKKMAMSLTSYVGGNGTTAYLSIPLRPIATNRNFSSFGLGATKLCPALSRHQGFGLPEIR
jgi:hypothetical protein